MAAAELVACTVKDKLRQQGGPALFRHSCPTREASQEGWNGQGVSEGPDLRGLLAYLHVLRHEEYLHAMQMGSPVPGRLFSQ